MAPSTTVRRLLKEVAELSPHSANPNPAFYAAPVSDSDLHEWHFTLLGPPAPSPYAGGLYHGRISLPAQYPLKPPNFRFLTASGRFEVNREICLSISGFHEETWMPAWGVRTALTALRSFMAEAGTAGQVGGLEASDDVRRRLAVQSKRWKCSECAKTNTEIMEEWWSQCRDQGVKVDDEGMGLEALPEGMSVEAFDRSKAKGKGKEIDTSDSITPPHAKPEASTSSELKTSPIQSRSPQSPTGINSMSSSETNPQPTPTTSSSQSSHDARTPTSSIPNYSQASTSQIQSQKQSQVQTQTQIQPRPQQETQAITLDRAITVLFLALCIMILKKIFYSSASSAYGSGASDDWEIGLSKEY